MVTASGARHDGKTVAVVAFFFKTILTHVNNNIYIFILLLLSCVCRVIKSPTTATLCAVILLT